VERGEKLDRMGGEREMRDRMGGEREKLDRMYEESGEVGLNEWREGRSGIE